MTAFVFFLCSGLIFTDTTRVPDIRDFRIRSLNITLTHLQSYTGGRSCYWLGAHPQYLVHWIPSRWPCFVCDMFEGKMPVAIATLCYSDQLLHLATPNKFPSPHVRDFPSPWMNIFEEDMSFLHFRGGSNWQGDTHDKIVQRWIRFRTFMDWQISGGDYTMIGDRAVLGA